MEALLIAAEPRQGRCGMANTRAWARTLVINPDAQNSVVLTGHLSGMMLFVSSALWTGR